MPDPNWLHDLLTRQQPVAAPDATSVAPPHDRSTRIDALPISQLLGSMGALGQPANMPYAGGKPNPAAMDDMLSLAMQTDLPAKGAAEKVFSAAVRHGETKKVFTHAVHGLAELEGHEAGLHGYYQHGYVTTEGRFVDKDVARDIGKTQKQLRPKAPVGPVASEYFKPGQLFDKRTDVAPANWLGDLHNANNNLSGPSLLDKLKSDGGFTLHQTTGETPKNGYAVGMGNATGTLFKKPVADITPGDLEAFLKNGNFSGSDHLGGWVDNGTAYIEPSKVVPTLDEAISLGRQHKEKAVGDLAAYARGDFEKGTIPVPPSKVTALANTPPPRSSIIVPTQKDVQRYTPTRALPQELQEVGDRYYNVATSPKFLDLLAKGSSLKGGVPWYLSERTQQKAVDALGDEAGPTAFNRLMEIMASTTARSNPANNFKRATWWKGLEDAGLLDPEWLRNNTLQGPKGMGHFAQRAHHSGMANLIENGAIDTVNNPKPGGFFQNLTGNWHPLTNDTVMSNLVGEEDPILGQLGFTSNVNPKTGKLDYSPKKTMYGTMEKAAQRAARDLHQRGLLDIPDGYSPTAGWQAGVWTGSKAADHAGSFDDVVDRLLESTAKKWGKSTTEANNLMWQGHPLDTPLRSNVLRRYPNWPDIR